MVCCLFTTARPKQPAAVKYSKVRRDSLTLEWEPSTTHDEASAKLTGYIIEKQDTRKERWTHVSKVPPTVRSYEVGGLIPGAEYRFRIRPLSEAGDGEPIQLETPVRVVAQYSKANFTLHNTITVK